jgi:hypothetical protein
MPPSTEPTDAQRAFAVTVLGELLHRIEVGNANAAAHSQFRRYTFLVSHAWTDGAAMYLVYTAPPSDRTWGLVRDTRKSLINPSPWSETDDPALYYYLLDLEENWPGRFSRQPGESETIWWSGDRADGPYTSALEIPEAYRYTPPPPNPSWLDHDPPVVNEPRRYAGPRALPPGWPPGRRPGNSPDNDPTSKPM